MFDTLSKKIFDTAREAVKKSRTKKTATKRTTTKKQTASSRMAKAVKEVVSADLGDYTISSGDTLSGIAQRYYGDASRWPELYEANGSVIGSNPNMIQVGQTLTIPRLD